MYIPYNIDRDTRTDKAIHTCGVVSLHTVRIRYNTVQYTGLTFNLYNMSIGKSLHKHLFQSTQGYAKGDAVTLFHSETKNDCVRAQREQMDSKTAGERE